MTSGCAVHHVDLDSFGSCPQCVRVEPAKFDLTYLSLGTGVQSSALLVCSALGLHGVPRADVAIFADTQDEPDYVYRYLGLLESWAGPRGIPILQVSKGSLSGSMIEAQRSGKRFVTLPVFTALPDGSEGRLMRQCTREFKGEVIDQKVRLLLGLRPRQRTKKRALGLVGISIDEASRMKPSRSPWIVSSWPLVDAGLTRRDCERIVVEAGLPKPEKSACVFCPNHNDQYWQVLKTRHPEEFAKAVAFDRAVRAPMRDRRNEAFVHRSLKPLDEVEFDPHGAAGQGTLFTQDGFGNECEGLCGV